MTPATVTFADVEAAAKRLRNVAHRTPVLTSRTLDERLGAEVFLKAECFQRVGAFKFRGAYNALSRLAADVTDVIAFSSGNHAQAVALAARLLGRRATIVMPEDAPAAKLAATREYGASVVTYDRYSESREELAATLVTERGAALIPPFDHPDIVAGQGTATLELLEDAGVLDTVVAPIGGGGLLAGAAVAASGRSPAARIVGVEPKARPAARQALQVGRPVTVDVVTTIADGQQTRWIGELPTRLLAAAGAEAVGVTDGELVDAMRFAAERLKVVLEPSGAAGLAALLAGRVDVSGQRVGIVLSGGNVALDRLAVLLH